MICLEGDCKVGEALIDEMRAVFRQAAGIGADELTDANVAISRRFGPTVTQLLESFDRENAKLARQVPFSIVCCNIKELGVKAQALTRSMRAAAGLEQTERTPVESPFAPTSAGLSTLTKIGLLVGGTVVAVAVLRPRRKG